jgi:5-formyltetrahydrofolate cyclo-ligase
LSADLRKKLTLLLKGVPPEDRIQGSEAVCSRLIQAFQLKRPASVALYSAMGTELALNNLAQWCVSQSIPIAFPRMETSSFSGMNFYRADPTRAEDWERAAYGFHQPRSGLSAWQASGPQDVILVPGLAFGTQGERLGRGKGHYDRYLANCPAFRIGVAFDIQITEGLGQNPWDQAMQAIVTPTRWIGMTQ